MGTLIVIENDKVEGTDTHNVQGNYSDPNLGPMPGTWTGKFDYKGKMTDALSDFVTINGTPVALIDSKSSLNPGESAPGGKHHGTGANSYTPTAPPTVGNPLPAPPAMIPEPVGEGKPSAGTGSGFVTIGGTAVLLDGDSIDTCDAFSTPKNSTVTAENQDFVSCSE